MFKEIFYNLLWFLTLTATAFTASHATKAMFEGTFTEFVGCMILLLLSVVSFVSVDRMIKREGI